MTPRKRTTVTLDSDVVEQLRALARSRQLSLSAVLNDAIRAGLAAERGGSRAYQLPSRPMGLKPGLDLTHALQLADSLEDGETLHRLA
jgi:hypothetical protein